MMRPPLQEATLEGVVSSSCACCSVPKGAPIGRPPPPFVQESSTSTSPSSLSFSSRTLSDGASSPPSYKCYCAVKCTCGPPCCRCSGDIISCSSYPKDTRSGSTATSHHLIHTRTNKCCSSYTQFSNNNNILTNKSEDLRCSWRCAPRSPTAAAPHRPATMLARRSSPPPSSSSAATTTTLASAPSFPKVVNSIGDQRGVNSSMLSLLSPSEADTASLFTSRSAVVPSQQEEEEGRSGMKTFARQIGSRPGIACDAKSSIIVDNTGEDYNAGLTSNEASHNLSSVSSSAIFKEEGEEEGCPPPIHVSSDNITNGNVLLKLNIATKGHHHLFVATTPPSKSVLHSSHPIPSFSNFIKVINFSYYYYFLSFVFMVLLQLATSVSLCARRLGVGSSMSSMSSGRAGVLSLRQRRSSLLTLALYTTAVFFSPITPAHSEQVVLLDTTLESSLQWTRYPFGPNSPSPGWIEESFTRFELGINWRSYVVCDVSYSNVNNWLWTPFIERGPANRMFVEIQFSMRDCSLFPGTALSCKETFSLLFYEFDAATKEPPFWASESYKLIDRIAADDGRFTNSNEVIINTEVRSVPVTKKGVYFAFRDQGACISLLSIKVYYLTCPEITAGYAHFPTTPTGSEVTSIEQATGKCVAHARVDREPVHLCTGDGKWSLLSGGCMCLPGYQSNEQKQVCEVCPVGHFKESAGERQCSPCPAFSAAPHAGATECRCDTGYYRATKESKQVACTRPPSKPRNLTVNFVDQSTVELTWLAPSDHGGRTDTSYRLVCDSCGSHVSFVPPHAGEGSFNASEVKVLGLNPLTTYRFQVMAENGVSSQAPHHSYVDIKVTTEAAGSFMVMSSDNKVPSTVRDVRITSVKSTEISLAWLPPLDPFSDIEMYEVRYYVKGHENNSSTILTTKEDSTLTALRQRTMYGFQVREKTALGWGEYSPPLYKMTGQLLGTAFVGDEDNMQVRIIVGSTIGAFVVVGVIVAIVLLVFRRSTDDCNKKQPSDCDTLEYRNGEVHGVLENPPIVQTHTAGSMTTPLFTPVGHHRTYIDPHTYEDPNQAIREFAREIDASYITIEAIIGGGEFGDVCKGKLSLPGRPEMTVAIKTLKPGSSDKARVDFLTEASIMGQFEHPNVIFLQGVVTRSNPVMIITEYMENGSLDHFLRVNDGKFQVLQLVGMLRCIASGMQYLSEMNYVHRDLAARNVLVNAQLVCKIADFGLSREIESHTEAAYTTRGGKIPVRWTAPEAIAFRKFTSASDVWSIGIVMWEVMSYGERPYWNWSNQDVIKSIEKGYRLPAPMECPEAIYQLMLDCWQKERNHRPNFASIVHTLDRLIRSPEALAKVAQNRCQTALGLDSTDLTQLNSVEEWLASLKMSRYLENFEGAGIRDVQSVARLNQRDLTTLGIALVGHQKKILQSIQTLRTQYAVNMSEGFLV